MGVTYVNINIAIVLNKWEQDILYHESIGEW